MHRVIYRDEDGALVRNGRETCWVNDQNGQAALTAGVPFGTHLWAQHVRKGRIIGDYDYGSGLVLNLGVLAMANDFAWAAGFNTLTLANFHGSGTGLTAPATTDVGLQTPIGTTATAGVQSLVTAANLQKYQTVGTVTYGGSNVVSEWGLFTAATLSATTGSPLTAVSATTATVTGSPYTASSGTVRGEQQFIILPQTTLVWGLILSNTTSVLTIPAWYKVADGTVSGTPGNTEAFVIQPVMWDHRTLTPNITVQNGDLIIFTYQLTLPAGG